MADFGQVVAAVAGGAIIAIAAMLALRMHTMQRDTDRQHRIDTAVRAMVIGVETFRHQLPDDDTAGGPPAGRATPVPRADGRTAARLRLVVSRPASHTGRAAPPAQRPYRSGPARGR